LNINNRTGVKKELKRGQSGVINLLHEALTQKLLCQQNGKGSKGSESGPLIKVLEGD